MNKILFSFILCAGCASAPDRNQPIDSNFDGILGGPCYSNLTCNAGLQCVHSADNKNMVCTWLSGTNPTGGTTSTEGISNGGKSSGGSSTGGTTVGNSSAPRLTYKSGVDYFDTLKNQDCLFEQTPDNLERCIAKLGTNTLNVKVFLDSSCLNAAVNIQIPGTHIFSIGDESSYTYYGTNGKVFYPIKLTVKIPVDSPVYVYNEPNSGRAEGCQPYSYLSGGLVFKFTNVALSEYQTREEYLSSL